MRKSIFEIIKRKSLPFIVSFRTDLLTHDMRDIEAYSGVPFIHYTGTSGTTMIFLQPMIYYPKKFEKVRYIFGMSDRYHILKDSTIDLVKAIPRNNRTEMIQYFDGHKVHKVTMEQSAWIVRQYYIGMMKQFKADKG